MIKKNLTMLIITSVVILIPILVGLILWNMLPDEIVTHWNAQGIADGFSSKPMAVFALPAFLLAMHWLCFIITCADPKNKELSGKPLTLILWICPVLSLLVSSIMYATALGFPISVDIIMPLFLGAMFVFIGNYMPKCKQNYTIGIKVPWALEDEENWNKTHRFAGILWVVAGIIIMATAFIGSIFVMLPITLIMVLAPMIYSYCYYKKNKKS